LSYSTSSKLLFLNKTPKVPIRLKNDNATLNDYCAMITMVGMGNWVLSRKLCTPFAVRESKISGVRFSELVVLSQCLAELPCHSLFYYQCDYSQQSLAAVFSLWGTCNILQKTCKLKSKLT
jgi:hypothetical protein